MESWTFAEPPRTVWSLGSAPCCITRDSAIHQLSVPASTPLFPEITSEFAAHPRIESSERVTHFGESEVVSPTCEVTL